jgi:hypothetical protein
LPFALGGFFWQSQTRFPLEAEAFCLLLPFCVNPFTQPILPESCVFGLRAACLRAGLLQAKYTFGQNLGFGDSARPGGLEPPTSGFGDLRSTN